MRRKLRRRKRGATPGSRPPAPPETAPDAPPDEVSDETGHPIKAGFAIRATPRRLQSWTGEVAAIRRHPRKGRVYLEVLRDGTGFPATERENRARPGTVPETRTIHYALLAECKVIPKSARSERARRIVVRDVGEENEA